MGAQGMPRGPKGDPFFYFQLFLILSHLLGPMGPHGPTLLPRPKGPKGGIIGVPWPPPMGPGPLVPGPGGPGPGPRTRPRGPLSLGPRALAPGPKGTLWESETIILRF